LANYLAGGILVHVSSAGVQTDRIDTAARLRVSIARLARGLRHQDEGGVSATLMFSLATIAREGPVTLGELAALEQVTPPTITNVVTKLEAKGWVERIPDPRDRRVCRVIATKAGRRQIDINRGRRTAWLGERLADLDDEEMARLEAALAVLERLAAPREASR
jgi:DNA-binding MarR family transcriptional regulator